MDLSDTSVLMATPNMVAADVGEQVLILHLKNGQYFGLDEVGAKIWQLLQEPVTVMEIERNLLEEYDVEPEQCRREVRQLLSGLIEEGLVEVQAQ
jgi:hypothetical protein